MSRQKPEGSILIYDIETTSHHTEDAKIRFFGYYSYITKETKVICTDTPEGIDEMRQVLNDHSILVGYNSKAFDDLVLVRYGIDFRGRTRVDLWEILAPKNQGGRGRHAIMKDFNPPNFKLGTVVAFLGLGRKKEFDYRILQKDILTQTELAQVLDYTATDINITRNLFEYMYNYFYPFREYLKQEDNDRWQWLTCSGGAFAYKVICHQTGLPEEYADVEGAQQAYEGGFVALPTKERAVGKIFCLDYSSAYPHAFMMANLYSHNCACCSEQEKYSGKGIFNLKGKYCSKQMGKIEQAIQKFYNLRLQYKKEKDPREFMIKIIINSLYGISGSPIFKTIYNLNTASDCTYIVREMIKYARQKYIEAGYDVLYSDSVGENSEILFRDDETGQIGRTTFGNLFNILKSKGYEIELKNGKEYIFNPHISTVSMNNDLSIEYKPIKYIMRHYITPETKKCYKIIHNSLSPLIVTEDHSLINIENYTHKLIEKKPYETTTAVLYSGNKYQPLRQKINHAAEMLGFWIGDGSFGKEYYINFASGKDTTELLEKTLNHVVEFKDNKFNINKKGDIKISCIELRRWMKEHDFYGTSETKRIPNYVFQQNADYKLSFLRGLYSSDGTVTGKYIRYTTINYQLAQDIGLLLDSVGVAYSIIKENNPNKYRDKTSDTYSYHIIISRLCNEYFKNNIGFIFDRKQNKITISNSKYSYNKIKIEPVKYEGYVYDVEITDTHNFFANNILVHNTDSVYLEDPFNDENRLIKTKEEIINYLKSCFPFPQDTFNMGIDAKMKAIFFFKTGDEFVKKSYMFITEDNKLKIKGLPIIKSNASKLGKIVFDKYLKEEIINTLNCKFSIGFIKQLIYEELSKDISLAGQFYKIKSSHTYKVQTSLAYKVAKYIENCFDKGLINEKPDTLLLLPNNTIEFDRKLSVDERKRGKKGYCTLDEFKKHKLSVYNINIDKTISELTPFLKNEQRGLQEYD